MDRLDSRKETLLRLTVRRYVKTAEPVGSEYLSEHSGLGVSSATIRNELSELEDLGYLAQPHTSAGRIPGEPGYRYYVEHFLEKKTPAAASVTAIENAVTEVFEAAERLRRAAKALAEASQEAAVVGFAPRDVYYTGLANLFSKPEFRQYAQVTTMSKILDHLDEVMERMFSGIEDRVTILIGRDNPFGGECGLVIARVDYAPHARGGGRMPPGVIGLLGPMRMDYDADSGLLETATMILKETA